MDDLEAELSELSAASPMSPEDERAYVKVEQKHRELSERIAVVLNDVISSLKGDVLHLDPYDIRFWQTAVTACGREYSSCVKMLRDVTSLAKVIVSEAAGSSASLDSRTHW